MCGILAISSNQKFDREEFQGCLRAIRHRGPDGVGDYLSNDSQTYLAHVRLAILDLSNAGAQPMKDSSGRYVIVFNGEIYNFKQLQSFLSNKYTEIIWKSGTDTEVIIEGVAREGVEFLSKLNGIFALSIYDIKEKILHIIRDPLGVKPLYFTEQNKSVFFCSELRGLLKISKLNKSLRKQSLVDLISYTYVPEPYTLYEEFIKINPGTLYTFQYGKLLREADLFVQLFEPLDLYSLSEKQMIDCFSETFSQAVRRQMIADVPVSLFLSGGLDSSAIAYEMAHGGWDSRTAFTIDILSNDKLLDQQGDDYHYAKNLAKQIDLALIPVMVDRNLLLRLPEIISYSDGEFADPAALNTYLICERAKEMGIKVLLSGHGADEFLGGYRRYVAESIYSMLPSFAMDIFSFIGNRIPSRVQGQFNATARRLKRLMTVMSSDEVERVMRLYIWGQPTSISRMFNDVSDIEVGKDLRAFMLKMISMNSVARMIAADRFFDLRSLNLTYTDKMSMAHGVEVRVPFLDFDLVKLMISLPMSILIKKLNTKYVLRKAMVGKLPSQINKRSKSGFYLPIRSWLNPKNEMVMDYLTNRDSGRDDYFNDDYINVMLKEQSSGKADHSYPLFSLLCWKIWTHQANA